ncbi:glycosyltransferase [Streptomyces mirabilis]|uniref:glycosyltransferase n=1 Tax=Streptomyces mirabilis TaxID=68239 RepID=UPI003650FDD9
MNAVTCHASHTNTMCEALWHAVPLVVAPLRDDQAVVAGQVTDAGAGVRVRFGQSTPGGRAPRWTPYFTIPPITRQPSGSARRSARPTAAGLPRPTWSSQWRAPKEDQ